jgi:hypothetical protein
MPAPRVSYNAHPALHRAHLRAPAVERDLEDGAAAELRHRLDREREVLEHARDPQQREECLLRLHRDVQRNREPDGRNAGFAYARARAVVARGYGAAQPDRVVCNSPKTNTARTPLLAAKQRRLGCGGVAGATREREPRLRFGWWAGTWAA